MSTATDGTGHTDASGMTVAVTGASGFVGRYVTRALIERGHSVRALVWDHEKARRVLPMPKTGAKVTVVVGDISDTPRVDDLLSGCQACINLIGIIREVRGWGGRRPQTFQRLHVDATRLLVSRCESRGVKRFLQMSAMNVRDVGVSEYQRTKFEAEMIVRQSGLDWTIFRPSLIHGPDGEFVQLVKDWVTGQAPPYLFMPYFTRGIPDYRVPLGPVQQVIPQIQPIAVEDVAKAFAMALTNPTTIGEIYNLAGPDVYSWPEVLRWMRDHIPASRHHMQPFGVPAEAAAIGAKMAKPLGLGSVLPFDEGMAKMGAEDVTAGLDKMITHLGFEPKPFKESFAKYAEHI